MNEISTAKMPDSDEIVSLTELATFYGQTQCPKEWEKYRNNESIHAGFNGWAALFGIQWFLLRRLYWQGIFSAILEIGIPVLFLIFTVDLLGEAGYNSHRTAVHASVALSALLVRIAIGFWANIALYKKAVKAIREVDNLNLDNDLHLKLISSAGSINITALISLYILAFILKFFFEK